MTDEQLQCLAFSIIFIRWLIWFVKVVGPAPLHDDPDDDDEHP